MATYERGEAGCAGQWHQRGPHSVPHKLQFSQEAALNGLARPAGGSGRMQARGTQRLANTFCHAGTPARILTRKRINAESLDSPQTLLTFKDTYFYS